MSTAIFTTAEAAQAIGCDARTIRRWCGQLQLGKRVRGGIVLTAGDVAALARHVRPGPGQPKKEGREKSQK